VKEILQSLAKAAEFARRSESWLQLDNVVRYALNVLVFDLTTPLEVKDTDAWKHVHVIAECSVVLLEYLKGGGQLRRLAGCSIDDIKRQKPMREDGRTVGFILEETKEPKGGMGTIPEESSFSVGGQGGDKGPLWFEKIQDFDVTVHSSFIAFSL